MSQPMGQYARGQAEEQATQWAFSVNLTTTTAFDPNAYRVITGGATINLVLTGTDYSGTMQFNVPVMKGQAGATKGQIDWSEKAYSLADVTYAKGILSFNVPTAVPAFADNFNADDGAPIKPPPAGPAIGATYSFIFNGTWDGISEKITGGQAWVPAGWLEDAGGVTYPGQPPGSGGAAPTDGEGDDSGGGDPDNATWDSGGGG